MEESVIFSPAVGGNRNTKMFTMDITGNEKYSIVTIYRLIFYELLIKV